ncbi:MAG: ABC transporter ATP-binding protein, partial [Erysipelotrichia bacterium]|nr:ABC transporter ATP-binding protein [Erysipelotrichia bacterium]
MSKEKKTFILRRFVPYMGNKKILLPLSLVLSGVSAVLNIIPFVFVWYITQDVLATEGVIDVSKISIYAWLAFACTVGGVVLYFCA